MSYVEIRDKKDGSLIEIITDTVSLEQIGCDVMVRKEYFYSLKDVDVIFHRDAEPPKKTYTITSFLLATSSTFSMSGITKYELKDNYIWFIDAKGNENTIPWSNVGSLCIKEEK